MKLTNVLLVMMAVSLYGFLSWLEPSASSVQAQISIQPTPIPPTLTPTPIPPTLTPTPIPPTLTPTPIPPTPTPTPNPAQRIAALQLNLDYFLSDSWISEKGYSKLSKRLIKSSEKLDIGDVTAATDQLFAFISQVKELADSGDITQAVASELTVSAQVIISDLVK